MLKLIWQQQIILRASVLKWGEYNLNRVEYTESYFDHKAEIEILLVLLFDTIQNDNKK